MASKKIPVKAIVPVGGKAFSSVRKARAALMERANEILDLQLAIIKQALAAEDYETAAKANQFLLEHMPEEDGQRLIEISIDKPKQSESKPSGPAIQVGIAIGGVNPPKQLTEVVTYDHSGAPKASEVTVIDINDSDTPPNS